MLRIGYGLAVPAGGAPACWWTAPLTALSVAMVDVFLALVKRSSTALGLRGFRDTDTTPQAPTVYPNTVAKHRWNHIAHRHQLSDRCLRQAELLVNAIRPACTRCDLAGTEATSL